MEREEQTTPKRFNSMMSIWYGVIIGALQGYLVVQNVWKFVRYAELPWPLQKTPTVELNVYIGMTGLAVLLLPFFLSACFLKIGNFANDNQMLGKRLRFCEDWTKLLAANKLQDVKSLFVTIWKHCGPISSLLHLVCSVSLLFPQILMESVLVKNGFISSQNIWKTDLDIMLRSSADLSYIKALPTENGIETRVYPIPTPQKADGLTLEFVNYAIALFVFSVRYAQVFWECHKSFSVVFGLQQVLSSVHTLISLCTFSVLYKVHITSAYGDSHTTIPFLLDGYVTLLLHAITSTVLFLSSNVVYHLGFMKFTGFVQEKVRRLHVTKATESSNGMGWMYFPHAEAVAISVALAATQSTLVHDAYLLYQLSSNKLMVLYAVSTVAHFLCWIVLWLCLTFTGTWNFRINAVMFQPISGLDSVGLSAEIHISRKTPTPSNPFSNSLLVVCEGRAFPVDNPDDRRSILSVLPKCEPEHEHEQKSSTAWKKQTPVTSPLPSCMSTKSEPWGKEHKEHRGIKYMAVRKEVTFDDELHSPRYYSPATRSSSQNHHHSSNTYQSAMSSSSPHFPPSREFDSGDYAYLQGGRGSILKKFLDTQSQSTQSSPKARDPRESIYSDDRKLLSSSPVPTVDSSSGVSSSGSQRSHQGPPSSTPSQFSESSYDKRHSTSNCAVIEPTAHYEPVSRGLSRRSSMRATPCSPIYEARAKMTLSKEYPLLGRYTPNTSTSTTPHAHDIYGKLRWDNSKGQSQISSPNYESIYGKTRQNHNNVNMEREKEVVVENLRRPEATEAGIAGSVSDICPPIPPPLPMLTGYVAAQNSPYGYITKRGSQSQNQGIQGILIQASMEGLEEGRDYTEC